MPLYSNIIRSLLFKLDPEKAHNLGIKLLQTGLSTKFSRNIASRKFAVNEFGSLKRFGLEFKNPLGIAAGFDKNGIVVNQLAALGFGFVEVGTITFEPQSGNEKPRMFRIARDQALINRLGFNNQGAAGVVERLRKLLPECVLGVNIGKNKDVPNAQAIKNYLDSFDLAFEVADYIAVNISSPNTPNLRDLQNADEFEDLAGKLQERNRELSGGKPKPLLIKIAPDLSEAGICAITDLSLKLDLAGIIATNTTVSRNGLTAGSAALDKIGNGGLSGRPIKSRSTEVIRTIYKHSNGKLPVIGVGGIFTAEDAFEKISAGACLVQAYTGFVYQGVSFARDVNFGLVKLLKEHGFDSLDEAVGSGVDV